MSYIINYCYLINNRVIGFYIICIIEHLSIDDNINKLTSNQINNNVEYCVCKYTDDMMNSDMSIPIYVDLNLIIDTGK